MVNQVEIFPSVQFYGSQLPLLSQPAAFKGDSRLSRYTEIIYKSILVQFALVKLFVCSSKMMCRFNIDKIYNNGE